jgi:hypothetical protein
MLVDSVVLLHVLHQMNKFCNALTVVMTTGHWQYGSMIIEGVETEKLKSELDN